MEKIKVFLSDPQVLFREGIHFTLSGEDDFEVIGEATNNEDAFAAIEANPPNEVVLNMENGKLDGPEVTRRIRRNLPSVLVILVMDSENEERLFAAMKSGASACLTKDADPEYLLDTLRVIAQGSQPITETLLIPGIASRILQEFEAVSVLNKQVNDVMVRLSPKETEVLNCLAAGNNIEQTVARLNSNEGTVQRYIKLVVNKLVSNDRTLTVIEAAQRNLPSILSSIALQGKPTAEYITKEEFNEFKESLMERLKTFIGELT